MSRWILERRADAQTDQRLAERARRGDEAAFAAIVARYHAPLLAVARRLRSDGRAEDIVQQTFMNALIAFRSGAEVRHLRGWLHQILRHAASRVPSSSDVPLDPEREIGGTMVDDDLERRLAVRQVLSAMAALPDRQRQAMVATALEGRSRSAVAETMGLSDGAVRQLMHRARQTLREAAYALVPWPLQRWMSRAGSGPSGGRGSEAAVALSAPVPAAAAKLAAVVASGALAAGILGPGEHGRTRPHPSARAATAARSVHSRPGGTVLAAGEHARLSNDLVSFPLFQTRGGRDGSDRASRHESEHGHNGDRGRGASSEGRQGASSGSGSGFDSRGSGSGSSHGESTGGGGGNDGGGTSGSGQSRGSDTTTSGGSDGGSGRETVTPTRSSGGGPGPETVTTTTSSGGGPGPSPSTSVNSDGGSKPSTSDSPDGGSKTTTSSSPDGGSGSSNTTSSGGGSTSAPPA